MSTNKPKSYEEWLRENGVTYNGLSGAQDAVKSTYNVEKQYAEQLLAESNRAAENQYQKSAINANNRYRLYTGRYGSTAEQLANRGLTNSGYSQYLSDQAYGRMIDEQLAARALEAQTKTAAKTSYDNTMLGISSQERTDLNALEQNQKTSYDNLLQRVGSGEFSDFSQVSQLGINSNLSSAQMESLYGAYITASDNKRTAAFETALNNINSGAYTSFEQVQEAISGSNLTQDQVGTLRVAFTKKEEENEKSLYAAKAEAAYGKDDVAYLKNSVSAGLMTPGEASRYAKNTLLSAINGESFTSDLYKDYVNEKVLLMGDNQDVKKAFYDDLKAQGSNLFYDPNGKKLPYTSAKQVVQNIIDSGLLSTIQIDELERTLDSAYEKEIAKASILENIKKNSKKIKVSSSGATFDNFNPKYTYSTWDGAPVTNHGDAGNEIATVAKDAGLKDKTVFKYRGSYYVYYGGRAYELGEQVGHNNLNGKLDKTL